MNNPFTLRRKLAAGLLVTSLAFAVVALPQPSLVAAEKTEVKAGSYASPQEAWKAAQEAAGEIEKLVAAKNLKPVHEGEEKLTAALKYLQANPGAVADKAKFEGAVKNALRAAHTIHEVSDAGDQAKSEKALKTLQTVLGQLEKLVAR
jgi:hypothetical protein